MSDQQQRQRQEQNVTINVQSSGDPQLEGRILNELYSAGRQLSSLAAVIQLLLATRTADQLLTSEQSAALAEFEAMQRGIDEEKRRRKPARIVEALERLPPGDPAAIELRRELREWLAQFE
jgi:thioredoxin-like negative regulator of GroEL